MICGGKFVVASTIMIIFLWNESGLYNYAAKGELFKKEGEWPECKEDVLYPSYTKLYSHLPIELIFLTQ